MRDINRIDKVLDAVRTTWRKYPDLRLEQLLLDVGASYYTEDEDLAEAVKNFNM
jgi:uncharacterized protein YihD (DUF1040 family)